MKISSPRHLNRLRRLQVLVGEAGGATALAVKVGTPKTHISALLSGKRGIGDALAAKLERKCDKPDGWMDQSGGLTLADLDGFEGQLVTLFRQVDPGTQHAMLADLNNRVAAIANPSNGVSKLEPKGARTDGSERRGLRKNADQKRRHLGVAKQGEGKK